MATVNFSGGLPTDLTPSVNKSVLAGSYLDIQNNGWAQQYLPELYEAEVEKYGNRSIGSFLRMVGAEMPMASDQVIWSEQGRLHLSYSGTIAVGTNDGLVTITGGIDNHAIRAGQTVVIKGATSGVVTKGYVKTVNDPASGVNNDSTILLKNYEAADYSAYTNAEVVNLFVFGSEFKKGTNGMVGSLKPEFQTFTNNPIILKDKFEVSGSDAAQIGWVEVSGESGQSGYLWYLKSEGDTRTRFEDYLEMSMLEAEKAAASSGAEGEGLKGTEGLFAALESRGIVATNAFDSATFTSTSGSQTLPEVISDFDLILKELDKQGAIEENMLFLNRDANLKFDDSLANISAGSQGGTAYGVFNNSEDMALNLGFTGFRRGSYDFYKTDWKYLNNKSTRGSITDIKGVLVPAGTSSVYDQILGKNIRRPFLHVRYRASEADDRKMKSWIVGSVGGASTSDLDAMQVHYLSERCLVTQAANNFVLFK